MPKVQDHDSWIACEVSGNQTCAVVTDVQYQYETMYGYSMQMIGTDCDAGSYVYIELWDH